MRRRRRRARPWSWRNVPMGRGTTTLALDRHFTDIEMAQLRAGVVPEHMWDLWFVYWDDDALHFHNAWTDTLAYIVRFEHDPQGGARMIEAEVRDDEVFDEPGQTERFISYVIDAVLLKRPVEVPFEYVDEATTRFAGMLFVGRAALGNHPGNAQQRSDIGSQIDLTFEGPYSLLRDGEVPRVHDAPAGAQPGIYLWGVDTPDGFLVSHVGETGRSFRARFTEHLRDQLAGMYPIPEPRAYARGVRGELLWRGLIGPDREIGPEGFIARLGELAPRQQAYARAVRLMIAPFDGARDARLRVEAALADHLRAQAGPVADFLEPGIRYDRTPLEVDLTVRFRCDSPIRGLPAELEVGFPNREESD